MSIVEQVRIPPYHEQLSLAPWQSKDVVFTIERDFMLRNLQIEHEPHPVSRLETRLRRRQQHHWLPEKTRRYEWGLSQYLRHRWTADACARSARYESYELFVNEVPWQLLSGERGCPIGQGQGGVVLRPGQTLLIRFRNGRRPTVWDVTVHGTEMVERDDERQRKLWRDLAALGFPTSIAALKPGE